MRDVSATTEPLRDRLSERGSGVEKDFGDARRLARVAHLVCVSRPLRARACVHSPRVVVQIHDKWVEKMALSKDAGGLLSCSTDGTLNLHTYTHACACGSQI